MGKRVIVHGIALENQCQSTIFTMMILHALRTAFRNLLRHKTNAIVNILSLTIGLTSGIFIFLWVLDELGYDKFHVHDKSLYQVMINQTFPDGQIHTYGATPSKLKEAVRSDIPEVENITQTNMSSTLLVQFEEVSFQEEGIYSDSEFFQIFDFPLLHGNPSNPLPDNNSIAISQKLANKLFKNADPIGKTLQVEQAQEFMVSAVFADVPTNSRIQFEFVAPFEVYSQENPWMQGWQTGGTNTFLKLDPKASLPTVNQKLESLIKRNCAECTTSPFLYSFSKLYLNGKFEGGKNVGGRIEQVILFSIVAGIILLMACINFMNLATASAASRSKEVSVRKIIGANRPDLVLHFMLESLILASIGLLFAIFLVSTLLPFFNTITSKSIQLNMFDPIFLGGAIVITLVCGLLAGIYPAVFLSSFKPLTIFQRNVRSLLTGSGLRKTLVVIQFASAVVLMVGSIIIYQQIKYITNKDLGFVKSQVLVIDQNKDLIANTAPFRNAMLQLSNVENIGFGGNNIFVIPITTTEIDWQGKDKDASIHFKLFRSDEGFIPTMGIEMLQGRNFIGDKQDSLHYIINRKAMEVMGISEHEVIGSELGVWGNLGRIVGVTEDFHNDNLKVGIEPLVFLYSENLGAHYFVKLNQSSSISESLAGIEKVFKTYSPDYPFEFTFLDELFERQYISDLVLGKLSMSFMVISILISCLGLFGLATFTAARRIKELGIRKLMGATSFNLVLMLCGDFTKLVLISILIGSPIAWYLAKEYLSGFAFHGGISSGTFLLAALGLMTVALSTVGFQSLKAALANPAKSLKSE
ncbi:FtsX-like permease family protein [Mongoliibacter ruber]|uniref:FtsX-like permease family protein n=2 Tax=Mongoliibacter ruber TaxID=1750599 RepID=A0A2T0WGY7_9BACT|nr:FtsX-like permease family protein [Mongoliibacter ruber]